MEILETRVIELKVSQPTEDVLLHGTNPISIQPVPDSVKGSPTYSLEVSNNGVDFSEYSIYSNNVDINDSIQINYPYFPWQYIRLMVYCSAGDSGYIKFLIKRNGR